jgi:hypothetical protein
VGYTLRKCPGYATVNDHVKGTENIEGSVEEEEEEEQETTQKVVVTRRKINDSVSSHTL